MAKRWFLSVPAYAITNFNDIRVAAISAGITIVESQYRGENESEEGGKPTVQVASWYANGVTPPNVPQWEDIEARRKLLVQQYAETNQALIRGGKSALPMPTTEAFMEMALKQLVDENTTSATSGTPTTGTSTGDTSTGTTNSSAPQGPFDYRGLGERVEVGQSVRTKVKQVSTDTEFTDQSQLTSSDPKIATIDKDGTITGIAEGKFTINVVFPDGTKASVGPRDVVPASNAA